MKRSTKFLVSWAVSGLVPMIPAVSYGLAEHRLCVRSNIRQEFELGPVEALLVVAVSPLVGPVSIYTLIRARDNYHGFRQHVAAVQADRRAYGAA